MENKWDFKRLFKSEEEFSAAYDAVSNEIEKISSFKNHLITKQEIEDYLAFDEKLEKDFTKVYHYIFFAYSIDSKNPKVQEKLGKGLNLMSKYQEAVSFIPQEILKNNIEKYRDFAKTSKIIKEHLFSFESLNRTKEHVLPADKEELLSKYTKVINGYAKLHEDLSNADRLSVMVKLSDGKEIEVTDINYTTFLETLENQDDRRLVFEAVFRYYSTHKNTYASIYNGVVQKDIANMRAEGYKNILDSFMYSSNIPTEVYTSLVKTASTRTKPLKKYLELRKKVLGVETYHTYDRFRPLATSDKKFSYDEAKKLFLKATLTLGEDYYEHALKVIEDGRVDVFPKDGKQGGAYSASVGDKGPFILLNHTESLGDVFTLAHEGGHSMHTLYADENQPDATKDYKIFVAEIASTFNEHLLCDYLLDNTEDSDTKIVLLQNKIDSLIATFYRQTLFAEFELIAHNMAIDGKTLTYEALSGIMKNLYQKYYGIDLDNEKYKEFVWAYIPHMYGSPFYVYQYATSFSASMKLYQDVRNNVDGAFSRHINLLKSGGSDYPVNLVKKAGVDLTTEEPKWIYATSC